MSINNIEAATRLLAYIDKHIEKIYGEKCTLEQLTSFFDANWEKLVIASAKKYNIETEELLDAILNIL